MQDYVKWRGALFHRFLAALVDACPSVRGLAEFLLSDALASKVASEASFLLHISGLYAHWSLSKWMHCCEGDLPV